MPCHKADHKHEWPSTGTLTILPCETICYLCDSTKEYKPASALRKHVQTHIKNDKLPLALLKSTSGRPKLSSRPLPLHRQTAVVRSPAPEQEPQDSGSTPISSTQQVVQRSPLEQLAQRPSDAFSEADLLKHFHESHQASSDGPALPSTTAASPIAYNSMLRVEQSSTVGASEFDARPYAPVVGPVEKTRLRITPAEATHGYMRTHSPDANTLSYVPPLAPGYDPLHSPSSLGPVHPRLENEYTVRAHFARTELLKVQREHLAPITATIDSVENTVDDGRTAPPSCEITVFTPDLSGSQLHRGPCWRCSILSLEGRLTDRTKACNACQESFTTLRSFGFRLEYPVDQLLDCVGDFPRVLRWKHQLMLSYATIWFSDCEKVLPLPRNFTLKKITTDSWRTSLSRHEGWAEAFCIVVDAADQYCITDLREHMAIERGLECLDVCVGMLDAIINNLIGGNSYPRDHPTQYLKKSGLRDFLSLLFDTTMAMSESGHKKWDLDVFYGTLIVCMIRFVLFSAFRYSTNGYEPVGSQAKYDPTFLDGPKSQVYQPMLFLLESSMSTFHEENLQEEDAHFMRAAAVVTSRICRNSAYLPPLSLSMYSHASTFISHYSRECPAPKFGPFLA